MCLTPIIDEKIDQPSFSLKNKLDLDLLDCCYEDCSMTEIRSTSDDELNILHYNVRGLLNKQKELGDLLSNCSGKEIHIATINETWLKENNSHRVNVQGYSYVGIPGIGKKGSGVGFLINKNLCSRVLTTDLPVIESFEYCILEVELSNESLLIVMLYRPPCSNTKVFLKDYESFLSWLQNQKKLIILGCDHNLDLLKSSIHKQTDLFIDLNLDNNLFPCIMKPTRITKTSATLIDNIFISSHLYNSCSASVLVNDMSDHLSCKVVIKNMYPLKNKAVTKEIRKVTKKSTDQVLLELNKIDWSKEFIDGCDMTSINTNFKTFGDIIETTMNCHIPLRTINVNKIPPSRA